MGQYDVYKFLAERRLMGDNRFFTVRDVYKALGCAKYKNVRQSVSHLMNWDYLDVESPDPLVYHFRLKLKHVKRYSLFNGESYDGRR